MKQKVFFATMMVICLVALGCQKVQTMAAATSNSATPVVTNTPPADDAPRISLADAKKAFDDGTALFVDTRSESAYKQEHVKGSINIPAGTVDANVSKLPKNKKIIAYCS